MKVKKAWIGKPWIGAPHLQGTTGSRSSNATIGVLVRITARAGNGGADESVNYWNDSCTGSCNSVCIT